MQKEANGKTKPAGSVNKAECIWAKLAGKSLNYLAVCTRRRQQVLSVQRLLTHYKSIFRAVRFAFAAKHFNCLRHSHSHFEMRARSLVLLLCFCCAFADLAAVSGCCDLQLLWQRKG